MKQLIVLIFLTIFVSCSTAELSSSRAPAGKRSPTFGGEIEFSNKEVDRAGELVGYNIVWTEVGRSYQMKFKNQVLKTCGGCIYEIIKDQYDLSIFRITYPDGWWFEITQDPGTLEIKTRPSTPEMIKKLEERIDRDIYKNAEKLGLVPNYLDSGSGHIHIGITSAFGTDIRHFRNFMVDFANHPELASGVLARDKANAPALMQLNEKQIQAFQDLTEKGAFEHLTIEELAKSIDEEVYFRTLESTFYPPEKYQAFNVTRPSSGKYSKSEETVEIRSLQTQKDAHDFYLITKLLAARIDFLKKKKGVLEFYPHRLSSYTAQDKVNRFYQYVVETGLNWSDYAHFNIIKKYRSPSIGFVKMLTKGGWKGEEFPKSIMEITRSGEFNKSEILKEILSKEGRKNKWSMKILIEMMGHTKKVDQDFLGDIKKILGLKFIRERKDIQSFIHFLKSYKDPKINRLLYHYFSHPELKKMKCGDIIRDFIAQIFEIPTFSIA